MLSSRICNTVHLMQNNNRSILIFTDVDHIETNQHDKFVWKLTVLKYFECTSFRNVNWSDNNTS